MKLPITHYFLIAGILVLGYGIAGVHADPRPPVHHSKGVDGAKQGRDSQGKQASPTKQPGSAAGRAQTGKNRALERQDKTTGKASR